MAHELRAILNHNLFQIANRKNPTVTRNTADLLFHMEEVLKCMVEKEIACYKGGVALVIIEVELFFWTNRIELAIKKAHVFDELIYV